MIPQRFRRALFGLVVLLAAHVSGAQGRPSYQLDASQSEVISLTNLYPDRDCHPARYKGLVVKRQFDNRGTLLEGFTIEGSDGQRSYVNVDTEAIRRLDMATLGWIAKGLQTLIREGHKLDIRTKLCGAAGRVEILDAIYSSSVPPTVPRPPITQPLPTSDKFSLFALTASAIVFLVGIVAVRIVRPESTAARLVVGVLVAVASSLILHSLGVKDGLTLLSVTLLGGLIVISASLFF